MFSPPKRVNWYVFQLWDAIRKNLIIFKCSNTSINLLRLQVMDFAFSFLHVLFKPVFIRVNIPLALISELRIECVSTVRLSPSPR